MRDIVVDKTTAENDFNRFVESMDLRLDRETMDQNERRDINEDVEVIIWEIMHGILSVDEDGKIVLHPKKHDPITFDTPMASTLAAMDRLKEHQKIGQTYAMIAGICDAPASAIKHKLTGHEYDSCQRIFNLFFAK